MIGHNDVMDALTVLAANASDKTPSGRATAIAWLDHFGRFPHLTREELLDAVNMYCERPRERLVQPADISQIARTLHQESMLRNPLMSSTEVVAIEPARGGREHDGSYYGRYERVQQVEIEVRRLPEGNEQFRFFWDGPKYQPFVGQWFDIRQLAVDHGKRWMDQTGADIDLTEEPGRDEHPPGPTCVVAGCPKPSTFDAYCAKHFCLVEARKKGLPLGNAGFSR